MWPRSLLGGLLFTACGPDVLPSVDSGSGSTASMPTSTGSEVSSSGDVVCPENVHTGDLEVDDDSDLTLIASLTRVTGFVEVDRIHTADLSFFGCLQTVEKGLYVRDSNELETLEGLGRIVQIGSGDAYGLTVEANDMLRSLMGLESLRGLDSVVVRENRSLMTLGLDDLETVDTLVIGGCSEYNPSRGNAGLTDITGLSGMKTLRVLSILGNENLVTLDGLRVLAENDVSIDQLIVMHNRALPKEHVQEIAELLQPNEAYLCGNRGDERPWEKPDPDTFDPEFCRCTVGE